MLHGCILSDTHAPSTLNGKGRFRKNEKTVHSEVEELVELGLITPYGNGRGRTCMISAEMYAKAGNKAAFVNAQIRGVTIIAVLPH